MKSEGVTRAALRLAALPLTGAADGEQRSIGEDEVVHGLVGGDVFGVPVGDQVAHRGEALDGVD